MIGRGSPNSYLNEREVAQLIQEGLAGIPVEGKKVLVIIPDRTRTFPLPLFFKSINQALLPRVKALNYIVALGTHPAMTEAEILAMAGLDRAEMDRLYPGIHLYNHSWNVEENLTWLGSISPQETERITEGRLSQEVPVKINRKILDHDLLLVCGPVFPHEVVGFSGGNKYFYPGIGGSEIINFSHWLGALVTSYEIIGKKVTPVRQIINRAAGMIPRPRYAICSVVSTAGVSGVYVGTPEEAYSAAADLSAQTHVVWVERPFRKVLSVMPAMYDDLWVGSKGMYKVEPAVADGGEVIIYAPHIHEISYTHGESIRKVGYHVRDYFLKQWDQFKNYPLSILAHSTHLKGIGSYQDGLEKPRIRVTLATGISEDVCRQINLGYLDPGSINLDTWANQSGPDSLMVPRAGEDLYRLKSQADPH